MHLSIKKISSKPSSQVQMRRHERLDIMILRCFQRNSSACIRRHGAPLLWMSVSIFALLFGYEQDTNWYLLSLSKLDDAKRTFSERIWLQIFTCAEASPTIQSDVPSESELPKPINYYELLDLESPDMHRRPKTHALYNRKKRSAYRSRITNNQIKKAYRKQAQLYHPDKLAARRLKQDSQTTTNRNVTMNIADDPLANMTIEDATSQFAKIAEAYQVLIDPAQRYEYDWELLEMEDEYEEERLSLLQEQQTVNQDRHDHNLLNEKLDSFSFYNTMRNGASNINNWKNSLNLDPWAVFEEFFFQESTIGDEPPGNNDEYRSGNHQYGYQRYRQSQWRQLQTPRVSERTIHRGFDHGYGANVFTVLRREDYIHDDRDGDGKYYYQILGQDFISGTQVDPYTGFTLREYYSAITEPYMVEEGYSNKDDDSAYNYHEQSRPAHIQRQSIHKLEQGEFITPNRSNIANQWISPNGRYEGVLSTTCELQILRHDNRDDNPISTVVWTTETYIPHSRANGCHLTLNSLGQLSLSVDYGSGLGSATSGNTLLWTSPLPPMVPRFFQEDNGDKTVSYHYYSSLDNDGVIAIYRVQTGDLQHHKKKTRNSKPENNLFADQASFNQKKGKEMRSSKSRMYPIPKIVERLSLIYHQLSKASNEYKTTKAALAWDHVRFRVGKLLTTRPRLAVAHSTNHLSENFDGFEKRKERENVPPSRNEAPAECVYSTSPVGCLTPGRNAIHLSKRVGRFIKNSVRSMDSKVDKFISYLTETTEYNEFNFIYDDHADDDILDTLMRVTGAAGATGIKLGRAGVHVAQVGLNRGKKVAGNVVGKMKEKVGDQSSKWSKRLREKDDVDSFF